MGGGGLLKSLSVKTLVQFIFVNDSYVDFMALPDGIAFTIV